MRLAIVGATPNHAKVTAGSDGCYDIASLANALAGRGHDVTVYTASPTSTAPTGDYQTVRLPTESGFDGHPEALMPLIGDLGRQLVDEWSHRPPDVVHCHGWAYGMASQLAANRRPVPTVQSFHGLGTLMRLPRDESGTLETRIKLQTLLAKNATSVAAACTDDLFELVRFGCPRRKISVVPTGISVDENSVGMARASRAGGDHEVVAVASGPARPERLAEVVRAVAVLPHTRLRIVDSGGVDQRDIHRILALAGNLGLGDRCRIAPVENDGELNEVLQSADVVVCPASYDAYGVVALQAMAGGTAVVAAATGGMRDAVIADVTGVLIPPANVDALRRALKSILDQPVLREGMGLAGRSRARSRYSWDRIAVDAEVTYHDAARRPSGAARTAMA